MENLSQAQAEYGTSMESLHHLVYSLQQVSDRLGNALKHMNRIAEFYTELKSVFPSKGEDESKVPEAINAWIDEADNQKTLVNNQLKLLSAFKASYALARGKFNDKDVSQLSSFESLAEEVKAEEQRVQEFTGKACEATEKLMARYQTFLENLQAVFAKKQQAVEEGMGALSSQQGDAIQRSYQVVFLQDWLIIIEQNIYQGTVPKWVLDTHRELGSLFEKSLVVLASGGASAVAVKAVEYQGAESESDAGTLNAFLKQAIKDTRKIVIGFAQLTLLSRQINIVFEGEGQVSQKYICGGALCAGDTLELPVKKALAYAVALEKKHQSASLGKQDLSNEAKLEEAVGERIIEFLDKHESYHEILLPIIEGRVLRKQEDTVLRMCQVKFLLNWLAILTGPANCIPFEEPMIERLEAVQAKLKAEHAQLTSELQLTPQPSDQGDQGSATSEDKKFNTVLLVNLEKLASSHDISAPSPDKGLSALPENVVAVCEAFIGEAYKKLEGYGSQLDQYQQTFMALQEASQRMSDEKIRQALRQDEQQTLDQADNSMAELRKSLEGQWDRKVFKDGYDLVTRSLDPRKVSPGDDDSMRLCVLYCFSVKISTVLAAWPSCEIHEGKLGEYQQQSEKLGQIIQRLRREFEAKLEAIQRDPKALGTTSDEQYQFAQYCCSLVNAQIITRDMYQQILAIYKSSMDVAKSSFRKARSLSSKYIIASWVSTIIFAYLLTKTSPWQNISSLSQVSRNQWLLFAAMMLSLIIAVTVTLSPPCDSVPSKKR